MILLSRKLERRTKMFLLIFLLKILCGSVVNGSGSEFLENILTSERATTSSTNFVPNYQNESRKSTSSSSQVPSSSQFQQIVELSTTLSNVFTEIKNDELVVAQIQEIFDSMELIPVYRNDLEIAANMSQKLAAKLTQSKKTLNEMCNTLRSNRNQRYESVLSPCPSGGGRSPQQTILNEQINFFQFIPQKLNFSTDANFDKNFLKEILKKKKIFLNFRQQYFMATESLKFNGCSSKQQQFSDEGLQLNFLNAIRNKHVVLLVDNGNSLNTDQFESVRAIVRKMTRFLNENDFLEIVTVADEVRRYLSPSDESCAKMKKVGSRERIAHIVDDLSKSNVATNHSLGFEFAFKILNESLSESPGTIVPAMIVYISRGFIKTFNESRQVLEVIAAGQDSLAYPVQVNAFQIVIDEKVILYEKQFLTDIVTQNFTKYNITTEFDPLKAPFNTTGLLVQIPSSYNLQNQGFRENYRFAEMFRNFLTERFTTKKIQLSGPKIDENSKTLVISMTKTCETLGVLGIDLYLSDLAEDVTYYNRYQKSYAFIVDLNGRTIMHPSFPRPITARDEYTSADISLFEVEPEFEASDVRSEILSSSTTTGNMTISKADGSSIVTYSWSRASDYYVIVIVSHQTSPHEMSVNLKNLSPHAHYMHQAENANILYHLDIYPTQYNSDHFCRHFKQIATLDSGAIYLSATSFQSPFFHLKINQKFNRNVSLQNIQPYLAYIKDTTRLLANPGLLPEVRNDVAVLQKISSFFKEKFNEDSDYKNFIIRFYITTVNGVMQIYPGTRLDTSFEPTRRNWFKKAMEFSGKIVVTEPYLDAGGAGNIVTISHTIFEGRASSVHNAENDLPVAVVSIDLTHGWFYRVLLKSANFCGEANVKCFLMDDKGFVISHPTMMTTPHHQNFNRHLNEHITYKESYVANDILNHNVFIKKNVCVNYLNRTIQRFYQLNTSLDMAITNYVNGEKTKYQIKSIEGTNIFLGIVNSSFEGDAFCPCSTVDRLCLNCNRMEQTECECPCECPLNLKTLNETLMCRRTAANGTKSGDGPMALSPPCPARNEQFSGRVTSGDDGGGVFDDSDDENDAANEFDLKSCIHINCDSYTTQFNCLGVMGCEWCQMDIDGETSLNSPFCASQISCYGGILGSNTPYGDGQLGPSLIDQIDPPAYSALGPIVGAIITLCLVVGFAMYCYKQNTDNGDTIEHLYVDSVQDNYGMPMARLDFKDLCQHDDQNDPNGNQKLLLNAGKSNSIAISEISPYRISTNYRRPNGDSDHGYSTMTPHEDSEHIGFNLAEPLIQNQHPSAQQKRFSLSDSASINTSVSSPHNNCHNLNLIPIDRPKYNNVLSDTNHQTVLPLSLPPNNHYEVAVDVHRHMEAS